MLVFSLAACEKRGPAEKAGEKVEKAGDQIKEKTEK